MSSTPPTPPDPGAGESPETTAATDLSHVSDTSAGSSRRGLTLTIGVVVACVLVAAGLVFVALRGADDGSTAAGTDHSEHDDEGHSGTDGAAAGHEGHDEQVLAGCDAEAYHNTMMMFDPTAADGLLDSGCTWPYDATIAVDGGAEDPAIAAEYEPRRYAEFFEVVTRERYGMCSVATLADERVDGFVFGFGVALNPAGCAENVSTVQADIREYASRAWRDTAAHTAKDAGTAHVIVLGRWVVSIDGDDADGAARLASLLQPLGAVEV